MSRVNWLSHCGERLVIDHWRMDDSYLVFEPVFACTTCGMVGYREIFDPDPVLDWFLQLGWREVPRP